MNFQEKLLEATHDFRARAVHLSQSALVTAREGVEFATRRVEKRVGALKTSLSTLGVAGRELERVARRHGTKFVKQNATLARAARMDVTALALTTLDAIANRDKVAAKRAKTTTGAPRARKPAPRARVAKAA